MALHPMAKLALTIIYTPLLLNAFVLWIVNTIYWKEQWECITCRADDEPSIVQQFLYFSVWSLWLTMVVFFAWAVGSTCTASTDRPLANRIAEWSFRLALPHVVTVMTTYIYYVALNPPDTFLDEQACYTLSRGGLSRSITDNRGAINAYLVCALLSDVLVHWMSAPLLLVLLWSGELEYDPLLPYSTILMIALGISVGLADTYGSTIYCGNAWFNVGMSILINFFYHVLFALGHRRIPSFLYQRCARIEKDDSEVTLEKTKDAEACQ